MVNHLELLAHPNGGGPKIAKIIVDVGEMRFSGIGGFTSCASYALGADRGGKQALQRTGGFSSIFVQILFYPIGPYKTTKSYVFVCYDKKIHYHRYRSRPCLWKILCGS